MTNNRPKSATVMGKKTDIIGYRPTLSPSMDKSSMNHQANTQNIVLNI